MMDSLELQKDKEDKDEGGVMHCSPRAAPRLHFILFTQPAPITSGFTTIQG
jgi:hypothetical protein